MPAVYLLEARLEASDVGFLVREAHPRGSGLVGGGQVGVPKRKTMAHTFSFKSRLRLRNLFFEVRFLCACLRL